MRKLVRINPGFYAAVAAVAALVAGILLGGFGDTRANGSLL